MLDSDTGACDHCGSRAFTDRRADFLALYRAATEGIMRDMVVVHSKGYGDHYADKVLHRLSTNVCPCRAGGFAESDPVNRFRGRPPIDLVLLS